MGPKQVRVDYIGKRGQKNWSGKYFVIMTALGRVSSELMQSLNQRVAGFRQFVAV
jgi:hypothetical protein